MHRCAMAAGTSRCATAPATSASTAAPPWAAASFSAFVTGGDAARALDQLIGLAALLVLSVLNYSNGPTIDRSPTVTNRSVRSRPHPRSRPRGPFVVFFALR